MLNQRLAEGGHDLARFTGAEGEVGDHKKHPAGEQHGAGAQLIAGRGLGFVFPRDDHPDQQHQREHLDHDLRDGEIGRAEEQVDHAEREARRPDGDDRREQVPRLRGDERGDEHEREQRQDEELDRHGLQPPMHKRR
jgi:hypothetical protein